MWEITLFGEKQDYMHFVLFEDFLNKTLSKNVIVAISDSRNNLCCSIVLLQRKYLNFLKRAILELIIKINKEDFFKENMKTKSSDSDINYFSFNNSSICKTWWNNSVC